MVSNKTISTSDLKRNNIVDIVKVIHRYGPITKPDIARLSNLTSATVHNLVSELLSSSLVVEDGTAKSNGGRKAVLYRINSDFGYVIGQSLGIDYIYTNILNINLDKLYEKKVYCALDYSETVIRQMIHEIEYGIEQSGLNKDECLGIGISIPGQLDHQSGVVKNLTNINGWTRIPVKSIVEGRTGIRTFVENDNNAYALALKWLNIVPDNDDVVSIMITEGVGTGVLTQGRLFYGSHSNAGEIGHTTIQFDGPKCNCGNRGCIEVLTSDISIIQKVRKQKKIEDTVSLKIESVINMAKEGDQEIYNILKEACTFISIAIDNVIKAYDPGVIVILNRWLGQFTELTCFILDSVFTRCTWIKREDLRIIVYDVNKVENIGASTLVMENTFINSENNLFLGRIIA